MEKFFIVVGVPLYRVCILCSYNYCEFLLLPSKENCSGPKFVGAGDAIVTFQGWRQSLFAFPWLFVISWPTWPTCLFLFLFCLLDICKPLCKMYAYYHKPTVTEYKLTEIGVGHFTVASSILIKCTDIHNFLQIRGREGNMGFMASPVRWKYRVGLLAFR